MRLKSLVLSTNISGIAPHVRTGGGGGGGDAARRPATVALPSAATDDPLTGAGVAVAVGGVGPSVSAPPWSAPAAAAVVAVIAVWLSMQTSATVMHIRCELMLRKPMKPSSAIANRLENQNRGTAQHATTNRPLQITVGMGFALRMSTNEYYG